MILKPKPGENPVKDPVTGMYLEPDKEIDTDTLPKAHALALLRLHIVDGSLIEVTPEVSPVKKKTEV